MTCDERLEALTSLPDMDDDYVRITRVYRPGGTLGYELRLLKRANPHMGALHFFGTTIHEALLSAEKELL